jgi:steroid delta-isomerase-like uncharacterized protein
MPGPAEYPKLAEDAFNRRDLAALARLWAPDFHYSAPGGEETSTREAAVTREQALFDAFPDIRADLSSYLVCGEALVIEGIMSGTHDGPLRLGDERIAATHRPICIRFVGVFSFEAGLVRRERVYYDRLELLQRLGMAAA